MNQHNKTLFKVNATIHGGIDYFFVVYLLIAPLLLNISFSTILLTFSIAIVHLFLTLLTDFKLGIFKVVPFKIHGAIEFFVSILLIVGAFILQNNDNETAKNFYLVNGVAVFLTWLITDYSDCDV